MKDPKSSLIICKVIMPGEKRKRCSYDARFKLKVVQYAKDHGNNSKAAREFGVSERQVREWKKMAGELQEMPKTKRARRGRTTTHVEDERVLNEWVMDNRRSGNIVTRDSIRLRAKSTFTDPTFLASTGWCTNFMNRYDLSLRAKTKISQRLPRDLEEKLTSFQTHIIRMRQQHDYPLSNIGNMDETPLTFDLPGGRTVHPTGEWTVLIRTTGHEKTGFTVVLACMADGTKLKPMVIFKRKTMPKDKFPPGVVVHVHEKGWMDSEGMLVWLEKVWAFRPGGFKSKSLMVWDSFAGHLVQRVKDRVTRGYNTDLAVIPGGMTPVVQPLDVSLNRPFKCHYRAQWSAWMASGSAQTTAAGNLKRPDLATVVGWVKEAWEKIETPTICYSFKKCGISNSLDGTEDDILWQENNGNDESDSEPEEDEAYDDIMTEQQVRQLLEHDDGEEDFRGF